MKQKPLIIILLLITCAAVGVSVWAIFFRDNTTVLVPDYAPQVEEENVEIIPNDDDTKLEQPEGGGSVSLLYSKKVEVNLQDKTVQLLFGNPGKSNEDMLLCVAVQDTIIAQSGIIKPGNQVKSLDLVGKADKQLSEGTYEGTFQVYYYNQETGEKAIVNTEIPLEITVVK